MPVMGPSENPEEVDKAYKAIREMLRKKYHIQDGDLNLLLGFDYHKDRKSRNRKLKEAIRLLFQLDSWENF